MARFVTTLRDEDLFSVPSKYDHLLSLFTKACKSLELQAKNKKKLVDLENEMTLAKSSRALATLSDCVENINLACEKIRTANVCQNRHNILDKDEFIEIPYKIQSEIVECLREVYSAVEEYTDTENGLLPKSNAEAATALIRTVESNVCELENFQILRPLNK